MPDIALRLAVSIVAVLVTAQGPVFQVVVPLEAASRRAAPVADAASEAAGLRLRHRVVNVRKFGLVKETVLEWLWAGHPEALVSIFSVPTDSCSTSLETRR